MTNMKMDKDTEFKFMLNRVSNHLNKETSLNVSYQFEGDEVIFTFHGTNYGTIEMIFKPNLIMRMGEGTFKIHLRGIRGAIIDAEIRTTRQILDAAWGEHER